MLVVIALPRPGLAPVVLVLGVGCVHLGAGRGVSGPGRPVVVQERFLVGRAVEHMEPPRVTTVVRRGMSEPPSTCSGPGGRCISSNAEDHNASLAAGSTS